MTTVLFLLSGVVIFGIGFVAGACWDCSQTPPIEADDDPTDNPAAWWETGDIRLSPLDPHR